MLPLASAATPSAALVAGGLLDRIRNERRHLAGLGAADAMPRFQPS